jgi:anti-sigma regulatory factor (Ser/Thr protein kinase)
VTVRKFHGQPESVPAARRFARQVLSDQSGEVIDAAELMVSELATNCVQHAGTDFEVKIHKQGEIRVDVRDANRRQPVLRFPAQHEPSGRGLRIVAAMSDDWGVIPSRGGKTVWFVLHAGEGQDPVPRAS